MSLPIEKQDLLKLKKISELALELEKTGKDQDFSEALLLKLNILLMECQFSLSTEMQRLSEIPDHLHPKMTMRHFLNFMIPIERLINKNLSDDDFLISTEDLQIQKDQNKLRPLYIVLDNIRSAFNVGSIFRIAECLGASEIHLCGYTPLPSNESVQKTSMNTYNLVPTLHFQNVHESLEYLKKKNIPLFALETAKKSISLDQSKLSGPCAFVFGNERFGLDPKTLSFCDEVISIPTFGNKNSLNVANTTAMVCWEWNRQNS